MDAGGWVGATLAVDGGRSVVGEGCSIVLSGVERWRPAAEAGGAETECLSVESALAPQSAMEYSSGVLRGQELPVTGPTSAISYPILI